MMRRGLIGHTGFVGSNLAQQASFEGLYNSKNIDTIRGQAFDQLVCAGVSAAKWIANADPEADKAGIARLTDALDTVEARQFVLISTIDVYPDPGQPLDEGAALAGLPNHAYGMNRLALEDWARRRFADCRIIRLPALFGPGLKKNAIYDLLHDNQVEKINPLGEFQWYPTGRLWGDVETAIAAGLDLVNLFTAPVAMSAIIDHCFPGAPVGAPRAPAPAYRLRTRHAATFGGRGGYVMDEDAVMAAITAYVEDAKGSA